MTAAGRFGLSLWRGLLGVVPGDSVMRVMSGSNRGVLWVAGSSVPDCWLGTYERKRQAAIARILRPGMNAWDIGAQAGFFTVMFARLAAPGGRVVAVEPNPGNAFALNRHLALNGIKNAAVVQAAVTDSEGMVVPFDTSPGLFEGRISTKPDEPLRITTVTLDWLRATGMPAPDVVKIDVEGGEVRVLEGAAKLLSEHRAAWFVAVHGPVPRARCLVILRRAGYTVRTLSGATDDASLAVADDLVGTCLSN